MSPIKASLASLLPCSELLQWYTHLHLRILSALALLKLWVTASVWNLIFLNWWTLQKCPKTNFFLWHYRLSECLPHPHSQKYGNHSLLSSIFHIQFVITSCWIKLKISLKLNPQFSQTLICFGSHLFLDHSNNFLINLPIWNLSSFYSASTLLLHKEQSC